MAEKGETVPDIAFFARMNIRGQPDCIKLIPAPWLIESADNDHPVAGSSAEVAQFTDPEVSESSTTSKPAAADMSAHIRTKHLSDAQMARVGGGARSSAKKKRGVSSRKKTTGVKRKSASSSQKKKKKTASKKKKNSPKKKSSVKNKSQKRKSSGKKKSGGKGKGKKK